MRFEGSLKLYQAWIKTTRRISTKFGARDDSSKDMLSSFEQDTLEGIGTRPLEQPMEGRDNRWKLTKPEPLLDVDVSTATYSAILQKNARPRRRTTTQEDKLKSSMESASIVESKDIDLEIAESRSRTKSDRFRMKKETRKRVRLKSRK